MKRRIKGINEGDVIAMRRRRRERHRMDDNPASMAVILSGQIAEVLNSSGATQVEQLIALDIARSLVPLSGAPVQR